MKTRHSGNDCKTFLEWAIKEKFGVSVSIKTNMTSMIFNSDVLHVDSQQVFLRAPRSGIYVPCIDVEDVSVTFTNGQFIYSFASGFTAVQVYQLESGQVVKCIVVELPESIEETDRRNSGRMVVCKGTKIPVSFRPENDENIKYTGFLADISAGGIGIEIPRYEKISLNTNERCYIDVNPKDKEETFVIPVRYRHRNEMENSENDILGFQITVANYTVEDSKMIAALDQLVKYVEVSSESPTDLAMV